MIVLLLAIAYAFEFESNVTLTQIPPDFTWEDFEKLSKMMAGKVLTSMKRVCDGCGKSIDLDAQDTIHSCESCGITFDLCPKCATESKNINKCPAGYGCNVH